MRKSQVFICSMCSDKTRTMRVLKGFRKETTCSKNNFPLADIMGTRLIKIKGL